MNYIRFHNYQYVGTVDGGYDSDDCPLIYQKLCPCLNNTEKA